MDKTIKIIPVVVVEVQSEDISERQAEVSRLKQLANTYAQVCYDLDEKATNTSRIGFCTDNPEILKVILSN